MSESAPLGDAEAATPARWGRDWRVWLGLAITAACLWFAIGDVPLSEVRAALGRADLWLLLAISLPGHIGATVVRALRWRHLTAPIAAMKRVDLYRAVSVGFMVNNLAPLRLGEFARAWYLARATDTRAASILGTVVLERVLDIVSVLAIALIGISWIGTGGDEESLLSQGARLMAPAALVPIAGLAALRFAPNQVSRLVLAALRPFPAALGERVTPLLQSFIEGLGALSGGAHLLWVVFHSITIWLALSVLPMLGGLWAFDLQLASSTDTLMLSFVLLAAVAVAVAIPTAPGFFGTYQLAFIAVLMPFGVDRATALALGLLVWFVFWVTLILQGLLVLRGGPVRLAEFTRSAGKDPTSDRR